MRSGTRRTSSVNGLYWMSCIISFWKTTLPRVAAMISPTRKASRSLMVMDKVLRLASMSRRRLARPLSRFPPPLSSVQQIRSLGANVLMVTPGAAREGGVRKESGSRHTLTESDAAAIRSQLPQIQAAAPAIRAAHQIVRGPRNWNTTVNGTTADYFVIRDWALSAGRQFSRTEEEGAGKVALIGASVAKQLFDKDDPVGGEIRIASVPFEVVGVLAEKGPSGTGQNQDDVVFVPISTAKMRLMGSASEVNREAVAYILVKAISDEAMRTAQGEIEALLHQRHRILSG